METTIFFYTGSGNSFWTSRKIAEFLGNTQLIPMAKADKVHATTDSQCIGMIFPVHIWGLPHPVIDFIKQLKPDPAKYYFAVAVNAGQVAATLIQLQTLLHKKGVLLSSGFSIDLPSNYIPWGGAPPEEKQQNKFNAALEKFSHICTTIRKQEKFKPEKGLLLQNIILSFIYRRSFPHVPKMDKSFFADEKCDSCAICAKICPAHNILMNDGKPAWQRRCEQCFACIQWCPEEAIQYGKNTKHKRRYHHPEISLKDMLACVGGGGEITLIVKIRNRY